VTAGEIRITGTPATADAAVAATRATAAISAGTPITGFSLPDLRTVAAAAGRSFAEVCADLRAAGLEGIAEVPIDAATAEVPAKSGLGDDIRDARRAGLTVGRLVVQTLPRDARVTIAAAARALQAAVGGFRVFAPLPRAISIAEPTTGYDDVKQIALARLLVGNIDSIQVDWQLYGPKLAQVALTMGADDVDGVAAFDPGLLGARRSAIEEIRGNIRAAALEPIERNARFEAIGV
jgi:aminodeoxyfutalosine synthase